MNTDSSQFITGREVAVLDMLNARDRRHAIQQELIRTHNATVISFTLNIPGPIKVFPLGEMTFEEGIRLIDSQLHAWKIPVLEKRTIRDFTGNEQFWSVKGDTLFIKEILCLLEDSLSFGRLFDIDVIRTDETKVSRTELGFPGRKCLLCSNDAFVCSRSRTHTVKELLDKACELMKDYFEEKQAKKLSSLSMQALLYEVSATPKPGLVDRNNTGAHKDMDIFTFEASAVSLNHYFEKFALCGMEKEHENGHEPFSRIFARLRSLGHQYTQRTYLLPGDLKLLLRLYVCKPYPLFPRHAALHQPETGSRCPGRFQRYYGRNRPHQWRTPLRPLWYERSPG